MEIIPRVIGLKKRTSCLLRQSKRIKERIGKRLLKLFLEEQMSSVFTDGRKS